MIVVDQSAAYYHHGVWLLLAVGGGDESLNLMVGISIEVSGDGTTLMLLKKM